jgi:hypothetical protein
MARKIKLRGTPEEHRERASTLLYKAKVNLNINTCDRLEAALLQTTRAMGHTDIGDPAHDLAWKLHTTAMKRLANKSCQFVLVRKSEGGRMVERVVLRPGKK